MAWVWLDKIRNYTLSKYPGREPTPNIVGSTTLTASGLVRGNSPLDVTTGPNMNIVFNIVEGLKVTITSTSESTPRQTVSIYIQNSPLVQYTYVWGTGVNIAIGFGYDVSLQRADMYIMNANSALGKTYCNGIAHATDDYPSAERLTYAQMSILYSYLIKTLETYDWESVRSVEGKGKTYKLTKYLNINNGYPVNNVSYVNNVDVSAKSKVNNMVDDVIVDGGKVTVKYTIPAGSYSYIKLVYKKNSIPASYSDGIAVDITQSSTSKVFDRLDFKDTAVYWFAIFTNKSTSEPVSLDLKGYNPVPAEYQDYIDLINGANFTYKYNLMDNWVATLTAENAKYAAAPNYGTLTEPAKNASYIFSETVSIDTWNGSTKHHLYVSTKESGSYNYDPVMSTGRCDYCVEPFSINIVGSGDSYSYTISNLVPKLIWRHGQNEYTYVIAPRWLTSESKWQYHAYSQSTPTIASRSFSGTLENCLKMLAMQVRNVDLYVNGELWSRKVS